MKTKDRLLAPDALRSDKQPCLSFPATCKAACGSEEPKAVAAAISCVLILAALNVGATPKPVEKETVTADAPEQKKDLIKNGKFEQPNEAKDGPAHWQKMDGLVYHWTTDPKAPQRGKVLRIDTSVDEGYALKWWVQRYVHGAPLSEAPPKVAGSGYSHVGGNIGGFCWSDHLIPVKQGGAYKVYVDAKGGVAKMFIRGYEKVVPLSFGDEQPRVQQEFREARGEPLVDENGRPVRYRLRYQYQKWIAVGGSEQWKTYTHNVPSHPNSREITEDVSYIRIMLYPYWPPGDYWFDNIRVVEVEPAPQYARPDAEEADFEEGKVVR